MASFKKTGNRATLFLAGFSLVLFSLTVLENSNTDAQVRTVQLNLDARYVTVPTFRKLLEVIKRDETTLKDNSRLIQQLKQQVEGFKKDLHTMSRAIDGNKEQYKKFDDKINYDLDHRVRQLEQLAKEVVRRLPRQGY